MTVRTDQGWSLRPYQAGDEAALAVLFATVFGHPLASVEWRWKLKSRPTLAENVWVAVADDARIVAQYAGIPVEVHLDGSRRPAMVAVDAMTAPDFRRHGILTALVQAAHAAWQSAGVVTVLGLPNQQWGSRTEALGWAPVGPLAWFRAPLHLEQALAHRVPTVAAGAVSGLAGRVTAARREWGRARAAQPVGFTVGPITGATAEFDRLWERTSPADTNLLVRDQAWVDWRFLQAPGAYHLLAARSVDGLEGYVACRIVERAGRRTGYIADLFTAPGPLPVAGALLSAALDWLWAGGAETARALAVPGSPPARALRAAGFAPTPGAFTFCQVPLRPAAASLPPAGWLLTGGEFDVV
jgi:GNAT superfamily N-acetyltransferase